MVGAGVGDAVGAIQVGCRDAGNIFLITSPVVLKLWKNQLPTETNQAAMTKPEDVNIVVTKDGDIVWNQKKLANTDELLEFFKKESVKLPQPAVQVRCDQEGEYEVIGKVIYTAHRTGMQKIDIITEPPDQG